MIVRELAQQTRDHGAFMLTWLSAMRPNPLHRNIRRQIAEGDGRTVSGSIYLTMAGISLSLRNGVEKAKEAMIGLTRNRPMRLSPDELAWTHYEVELLSGWIACTQDVLNVQVSPARLARLRSEIALSADVNAIAIPDTQICIRFDGSELPRLSNGMPVDMLYVEPIEDQGKLRFIVLCPLGEGNRPAVEGAAYMLDIDHVVETPAEALERSVMRTTAEMARSKLVEVDEDALRERFMRDVPLSTSLLILATRVIEQMAHVDSEIERGAPAHLRQGAVTDRTVSEAMKLGWSEVVYLD
jgi:hypothetical protein